MYNNSIFAHTIGGKMGTFTAQILVGKSHPYHGGIIPSHEIYLSENDRPAWILEANSCNKQIDDAEDMKRIIWTPTLENLLNDAMLMIALYIIKDSSVVELSKKHFKNNDSIRVQLYEDISKECLEELYKQSKFVMYPVKVILSVFIGSSLINHVTRLSEYMIDYEICMPRKMHSVEKEDI